MVKYIIAIDVGTTNIKIAARPVTDEKWVFASSVRNRVTKSPSGETVQLFSEQLTAVKKLLAECFRWAAGKEVSEFHIGITSHVASVLIWDTRSSEPLSDEFTIWMDTGSSKVVNQVEDFFGNRAQCNPRNRSFPVSSNLLITKLYYYVSNHGDFPHYLKCLQVQDALLYKLSGDYRSLPETQFSLCSEDGDSYSREILDFLRLEECNLPQLSNEAEMLTLKEHCPEQKVYLHLLPPDLMCSLGGLNLVSGEGFFLPNTSELLGMALSKKPDFIPAGLSLRKLNDLWILYGSTLSGGNVRNWLESLSITVREEVDLNLALALSPGSNGLIFLPYIDGERSPWWNDQLSGAYVGLRSIHSREHLMRAAIEGCALSKKDVIDRLPQKPATFVVSGKESQCKLWQRIRADVFQSRLRVHPEPEIGLRGIGSIIESQIGVPKQILEKEIEYIEPDYQRQKAYGDLYQIFRGLKDKLEGSFVELRTGFTA